MAVGFAALGTTIYVAHNQSNLTNKISKVSTEQQKLLEDTRNFYATAFVDVVQMISVSYPKVIDLHQNHLGNTHASNMLANYYDKHIIHILPKIEDIELVKVFGLEIAEKYRIHTTTRTSKSWDVDTVDGLAEMMHSYKEEVFNLVQLKDILLPFCDTAIIDKDNKLKDDYDLIHDTYLDQQ